MVLKRLVKYALMPLVGILIVLYSFKNQDLTQILELIGKSDAAILLTAALVFFLTHILRGLRWRLLITDADETRIPVMVIYDSIMASLLLNIFIVRFGEIYRCILINQLYRRPTSVLFGTVITERIIDVICLMLICLLVVTTSYGPAALYVQRYSHTFSSLPTLGINLLLFVLCLGLLIKLGFRLMIKTRRERAIAHKIKLALKNILVGLMSIRKIKTKTQFVVLSLAIWILYWLFTYLTFLAFPATADLPLSASLLVIALSGISMALPIQSGIGAFHLLVSNALLLYGLKLTESLAYATLAHGLPLIIVLFLGSISFIQLLFRRRSVRKHL